MDNYYIYIYFDSSKSGKYSYNSLEFDYEPIYVGKGKNRRAKRHITDCKNKNNKKGYRRLFYQKLRKMLREKNNPIISIYKKNLSEKEAFNIEIDLISKIGRRIDKRGPLCNNSIGGEGPSGTRKSKIKICVYDSFGNIRSIEDSINTCSKKFGVSRSVITKHYNGIAKLPSNGFRFRKETDNIKNLCPCSEIQINKKGNHSTISPLSKKVYQYNRLGELVAEYPNTRIASLETHIGKSSIQNNLTNRSKTCNNYIFKY